MSGAGTLLDAASHGNLDVLELALLGTYGYYTSDDLNLALVKAAIEGSVKCVEFLLDNGADINATDGDGDTALIMAVSNGHEKVVKCLLDRGCIVDIIGSSDRSVLHQAAWDGLTSVVKLLLQSCDKKQVKELLEAKEMFGDTPLMLACAQGHLEVTDLLIKAGSDLFARNQDEEMAIHHAARRGHTEVIKHLHDAGVDLNIESAWGYTPILYAAMNKQIESVKYIVNNGADINTVCHAKKTALHYAAVKGCDEMVRFLIDAGAETEVYDVHGKTPLFDAVYQSHPNATKLLIKAGANVNVKGQVFFDGVQKASLFYVAIWRGNTEIIQTLNKAGAGIIAVLKEIMLCEKIKLHLKKSTEVQGLLEHLATHPMSLKEICRLEIRTSCAQNCATKVKSLPLPISLQQYLLFDDF
ncbi:hypothetical protein CHS0354_028154 [Potamilus streckersoni]|uniref:SOCS box domain-containing protein n=1 Tax=Potamilus streckersoni TaxID=2493646 RepID=A0AAE0WET4_9BIVA|nr:hypothetical protein CHS0354_028154 [Potamilus streckersoni]